MELAVGAYYYCRRAGSALGKSLVYRVGGQVKAKWRQPVQLTRARLLLQVTKRTKGLHQYVELQYSTNIRCNLAL